MRTDRLALLSRASGLLTASLDWEATLRNVNELALPALGDFGAATRGGSVLG